MESASGKACSDRVSPISVRLGPYRLHRICLAHSSLPQITCVLLQKMALSVAAPQQHKQPSRKGKKAWRKHVDVIDIQEGLENVRDEVIKG